MFNFAAYWIAIGFFIFIILMFIIIGVYIVTCGVRDLVNWLKY